MMDYMNLQKTLHPSLIARIKIMANLDITEKRVPQDGHFRTRLDMEDLNVRVSMIPTVFGEKTVMRLLAKNAKIDHSGQFGMNDYAYKQFLPMLDFPNGNVYITGPTGSGKSTTLYMVLEHLAQRNVNISTIEDPVEKNIKGLIKPKPISWRASPLKKDYERCYDKIRHHHGWRNSRRRNRFHLCTGCHYRTRRLFYLAYQ
jgi:type IV pilus assembly protein PilB